MHTLRTPAYIYLHIQHMCTRTSREYIGPVLRTYLSRANNLPFWAWQLHGVGATIEKDKKKKGKKEKTHKSQAVTRKERVWPFFGNKKSNKGLENGSVAKWGSNKREK